MPAIDDLFKSLRSSGRKALMPFVTAGDPNLAFTSKLINELVTRGASLCEIGIPYSDPIADGPVIQASYIRALSAGVKLKAIFESIGSTAPKVSAPLVTMVSYAIVFRHGVERYLDDARQAGVAGLIVPDLPVDEAVRLAELCRQADLSLVQLVTPTTPRDRAVRIASASSGFLYYVSVAGITGERTELPTDLVDNVGWLREQTDLPICIGFGVSRPDHVKLLAPVADGLIVGSAIVRRIAEVGEKSEDVIIQEIGDYVATLIDALPK